MKSLEFRTLSWPVPSKAGNDAIWLWYLEGDEIASLAKDSEARSVVSEGEWARRDRLRVEEDASRFLASRILLRSMLALFTGEPPEAFSIEATESGRPEITHPPFGVALRFSITHTRGIVACLLSGGAEVGVDAEFHDSGTDLLGIATRFFARREAEFLYDLSGGERQHAFFDLWTLKEAYVKAIGEGLAIPLDQFSFDLRSFPLEITTESGEGTEENHWAFGLRRPTDRHSLAVAIRDREASAVEVDLVKVTAKEVTGALSFSRS